MFKRVTGLLILLSFLLVKSTSLFAVQQLQKDAVAFHAGQQTDDDADAEKESKQLEVPDEDFIDQPVLYLGVLTLSKKAVQLLVADITAPYISLPCPPPNIG